MLDISKSSDFDLNDRLYGLAESILMAAGRAADTTSGSRDGAAEVAEALEKLQRARRARRTTTPDLPPPGDGERFARMRF